MEVDLYSSWVGEGEVADGAGCGDGGHGDGMGVVVEGLEDSVTRLPTRVDVGQLNGGCLMRCGSERVRRPPVDRHRRASVDRSMM